MGDGAHGLSLVNAVELVVRVPRLEQGRVLIHLQKMEGVIATENHTIQRHAT